MASQMQRMLHAGSVLLAVLAGVLAGALLQGLPEAELAVELLDPLLFGLGAALVLPLAAASPAAEREGGFEALVAVRPIGSTSWALGRALGALLAALALVLIMTTAARFVGGSVQVPEQLVGQRMDAGSATPLWRFALPAGRDGPFELALDVVHLEAGSGRMRLDVERGGLATPLPAMHVGGHHLRLSVPDLAPARGDLFVRLRPEAGVVLAETAPQLTVGRVPLGRDALRVLPSLALALLLGALAALAAACAFRFETACLAGLLALAARLGEQPLALALAALALFVFAALGTALVRRAALP